MEHIIRDFFQAVVAQEAEILSDFFTEHAYVNWHNTNERFTVSEYIRANCEYPNTWDGMIERIEVMDNLVIMAARIFTKDRELSFHVTSFIKMEDGKIIQLDEYWGEDGAVPQWRLDKHIGVAIEKNREEDA